MTLSFFILNLFNALAMIYATSKVLNCKINYKNFKIYVVILILSIYSFTAYLLTTNVLRIIILFQIYNLSNIFLFKNDENNPMKITITSIICFAMFILSEVIVIISLSIILKMLISAKDINAYNNNYISYLIIIFFIIIMSIKPFNKFLNKLINSPYIFKSYNIAFCGMYVIIILLMTLYLIFFDLSQLVKLIVFVFAFVDYVYVISFIILSYKKRDKIKKDLDIMLEITTKYENVINEIKIKNHENRNELIVLKDLIKNNKVAKEYIENMIKNKYDDDKELITKVANIPEGGLKGLIYYKLLTMKSKKN